MKNKKSNLNELNTSSPLSRTQKAQFKRKIRTIFCTAGFTSIPTHDIPMRLFSRTIEVDSLFIYENIWLICEDTTQKANITDHLRAKNEAFGEIKTHFSEYVDKIIHKFPEKMDILTKYDKSRIKPYFLYIPYFEIPSEIANSTRFQNLIFLQPQAQNYLYRVIKCIKRSGRYEIFRFLHITDDDIGNVSSSKNTAEIKAPIIYPKDFTGSRNNMRIVSFMMSAEDLLHTCYVLRKDDWSLSRNPYQRLIEKNKIKKIRKFLELNGEAFYNNIIVALPKDICFRDSKNTYKNIDEINELSNSNFLILPKRMNSICVIDGQHRIFAHYENDIQNEEEQKIAKLRSKLHLLVTGLIFPQNMTEEKRAKIESEIFLDINSNAKPVEPNILLHIKCLNNPLADESLAQFVIEELNNQSQSPFKNRFQTSSLDDKKIKTASIVKFALRKLVSINPANPRNSLFYYWRGDKAALKKESNIAIENYVKFCASVLSQYFNAIKKHFPEYWENKNSKILSVTSINGFIIAFTRQLPINGVQNFQVYEKAFQQWDFDFSKENFPYTSSQYQKFSSVILKEVFHISSSE